MHGNHITIYIYLNECIREPHMTTLAVNYIMPFNSSTQKIDGYYNSSFLATAEKLGRHQSNEKAQFWLRSGLRLYSNNRKQLNSAVSQSHVNTVHTTYSQHCHQREKQPHTSNTFLSQKSKNDPSKTETLYLQDDYLHYSQMIQNSSVFKMQQQKVKRFFVLFLITAQYNDKKQQKIMSTFIHSRFWQVFSRSSSMAVGWGWQTDDHRRQNKTRRSGSGQIWHKMRCTVFPYSISVHLKVCLWTNYITCWIFCPKDNSH